MTRSTELNKATEDLKQKIYAFESFLGDLKNNEDITPIDGLDAIRAEYERFYPLLLKWIDMYQEQLYREKQQIAPTE